jgi:hypothetical protein
VSLFSGARCSLQVFMGPLGRGNFVVRSQVGFPRGDGTKKLMEPTQYNIGPESIIGNRVSPHSHAIG